MGVINMLSSGNYITVNKQLARKLGIYEALLLGELASEYEYWEKQGQLTDGFFFSTVENIKENTTLSDKQQRTALNTLKANNIVTVVLKGIPAKRYIKINEEQVLPYLLDSNLQNGRASYAEKEELDLPKEQSNKNNIIKNNNKNNKDIYISEFESLWKLYPNKKGKDKALNAYIKARKSGVEFETVERGIKNYVEECRVKNRETQYIKHGATWFNNHSWNDECDLTPSRQSNKGGVTNGTDFDNLKIGTYY